MTSEDSNVSVLLRKAPAASSCSLQISSTAPSSASTEMMDTVECSSYWDPVEAYKKYIPLPPPVNVEGTVDEKIEAYKKICQEINLSVDINQNYDPDIYRQVYFRMPVKYIKIKLELSGLLNLVPPETPEQELMANVTFNGVNEARWADQEYFNALFLLKSKMSSFLKTSKSVKIKNYAGYKLLHQQLDEARLRGGQKYEVVELESLPLGSHPYLSTDGRVSLDAIAAYREGAVWNGLSEKYRKEKMELVVAVRKFHEMCGEQGSRLSGSSFETHFHDFRAIFKYFDIDRGLHRVQISSDLCNIF